MTGSLEASDAASRAVQRTENRVSLDGIKAKIEFAATYEAAE